MKYYSETLYKRDINDFIRVWNILIYEDDTIGIKYGRLGGNLASDVITVTPKNIGKINETSYYEQAVKEFQSRVKLQKQRGYKSLVDIGLFCNNDCVDLEYILKSKLPQYNVTDDYQLKPMKCQPFSEGKMNYPCAGQRKLNGARDTIRWETYGEGASLFNSNIGRAVMRSKEGHEYIMPHITNTFRREDFVKDGIELVFDGELYRHGMPLNEIKKRIPIKIGNTISKPDHIDDTTSISFNLFDLAIPDVIQYKRLTTIDNYFKHDKRLNPLEYVIINSDEEALYYRDLFISEGYEGVVLRDLNATYCFGQRPKTMMKYKALYETECLIMDILDDGIKNGKQYIKFVLQNDKYNKSLFHMTPGDKENTWGNKECLYHLDNKHLFIGKLATITYRERTGVGKFPHHGNVKVVRDYE